jgi:MFS transporter, SP family, general alpha glucoside:H+ symporter
MGCIFIQFFVRSLSVLLVGELIAGLVLGFYAVITPTYASEICPVALRGVLTASINLFIVTGQLMANGVCAGTQRINTHWAYSAPFATQWLWPVLILICLPFAPESKIFVASFLNVAVYCFQAHALRSVVACTKG